MKALLIIAHGSRKQSSNDEVAFLTKAVTSQPSNFDLIEHAFLELTTPKVSDGIDTLIANGATEVIILPYFLAAGLHVVDDLPMLLDSAKKQYPKVTFKLLKHLGAAEQMSNWIIQQADI
ncbi:MAG: sirohydrochlorin ferrochelatase [Crocinitomicaceae bacterium]|jgi:sirohydrochlorin ferrochelatase